MFNILRNFQTFPKKHHHFTFQSAVYEGSNFSISLTTLVIVCLFYYRHPNRCEVVSHCGFDMHFPDGQWCWVFFHELIGHLYILFEVIYIQTICPSFSWATLIFIELQVLFIYSGCKSLIRYRIFYISSHFMDCLFTFLTVSFEAQKSLTLIKSNLSIFFLLLLVT